MDVDTKGAARARCIFRDRGCCATLRCVFAYRISHASDRHGLEPDGFLVCAVYKFVVAQSFGDSGTYNIPVAVPHSDHGATGHRRHDAGAYAQLQRRGAR